MILIHCPTFFADRAVTIVSNKFEYQISVQQLILMLMFGRCYLLIKLFGRFSKYQSKPVVKIW